LAGFNLDSWDPVKSGFKLDRGPVVSLHMCECICINNFKVLERKKTPKKPARLKLVENKEGKSILCYK
jgi:hypothetical protein